jgi:hypothetical protein
MLHLTTFAALLSLGCGAILMAQEPTAPPTGQEKHDAKSAAEYVKDLGSDSFRERTQAEKALRGLGKAALPELEQAAADDSEPEVQWRARRLVRQIERGGDSLARRERDTTRWRSFTPQTRDDIQQRFDELFGDLESDFGIDIPRMRFFHDGFYRDLQQQMRDLQERMQDLQGQMPEGSHGRSMSMQMGPDGVRVEIKTKNDAGEEDVKVYEAPDMKTFRQKYPDVLRDSGLGGAFVFGDGSRTWQLEPLGRGWKVQPFQFDTKVDMDVDVDTDWAAEPALVPPPPGKRLGVVVKPEIPQAVREYLGIDAGLMVEEVQQDTLASSLGIETGDIVLEIAGKGIASTKDVQDALGPIAAGKTVEVKVVRRGKELVLKAEKPDAQEAEAAPLEKRAKGKAEGGIR